MKFRYFLGKSLGSDIITDGTFVGACGVNWTCGTGWSIAANKATHTGATYNYIEQDCGFEAGEEYEITFTVSDIPGGAGDFVQVYLAGFSVTSNPNNNFNKASNGTYTVKGSALSTDSYIRFLAYGDVSISNVQAYKKEWNTQLENEPLDWQETSLGIEQSELLEGLYVKYIGSVSFWGDGYDYLFGRYEANAAQTPKEFCELIPIKIERLVNSDWELHFQGLVYLSEVQFNQKQKLAICDIEERSASQAIKFGRDKVLSMQYQDRGVYSALFTNDFPATICKVKRQVGLTEDRYVYFLFKVLRYVIHEITDLSVTADSGLLRDATYESIANVFQFFGITPFKNFADEAPVNTYNCTGSLSDYTDDLNKVRNIGALSSYPNNIPTINFESKKTLRSGTFTFTLDNNEAEFTFDESDTYHNVKVGFERPDNSDVENAGSFVQQPNWTTADYYSLIRCNSQGLDLVSITGANPQWIANQLFSQEYDPTIPAGLQAPFTPRNFFLQMEFSTPNYVSIYANYLGSFDWNNPDLEVSKIMDRWTDTLNSSFYNEDWGESTKTNNPLVRVWEFEAPLTLSDLAEIEANPNYAIQMTSQHFTGTIEGRIEEFSYSNRSDASGKAIGKFKIISE